MQAPAIREPAQHTAALGLPSCVVDETATSIPQAKAV
jgi:hypothetical protein